MSKRVTMMVDDDIDKKLRIIQAKEISKTQSSVSFSRVINEMLRKKVKQNFPSFIDFDQNQKIIELQTSFIIYFVTNPCRMDVPIFNVIMITTIIYLTTIWRTITCFASNIHNKFQFCNFILGNSDVYQLLSQKKFEIIFWEG